MASTRPDEPPAGDVHALRCMEVWGGNRAVEHRVAMPGLDGWISSRPHEGSARGGDVHYLSLCGGGIITRVLVADVSGHGESVGALAESLRAMMRRNINRKDQTRLVRALNRQFGALAELTRFATAVVLTYLATSRRLTVCNAGHPRPLWYRAESRQWVALEPGVAGAADEADLPLGVDDETTYRQFAVRLGVGDVVVVYTDALTESASAQGRMLGEGGLLELVRALDAADPAAFGPALAAAVAEHRGGAPPDDDATVLTLHHNGLGPKQLSLVEKIDVYAKVFGLKPS